MNPFEQAFEDTALGFEPGERFLVVMPGKTWEVTRATDDWPTPLLSKGKAIMIDWTKVIAILWEV